MTDEKLIARLRVQRTTDEMTTEECAGADYEYAYNMVVQDCREAADRIEALRAEVEAQSLDNARLRGIITTQGAAMAERLARAEAAEGEVEKLRGALRGRIHWIDGEDHCDCGECKALVTALTTEEGHE